MADFIVTITEVNEKKMHITADSQEAAEQQVQDDWNSGCIDLDHCVEFKIVSEFDVGQVI